MRSLWRGLSVAVAAVLGTSTAHALDPFAISVDLGSNSSIEYQQGYSSLEDAIDALDFSQLAPRTGYTGSEQVTTDFFLRGLNVSLEFTTTGEGDLLFAIPGVDFNNGSDFVLFTARNRTGDSKLDRGDTLQQLKDYLKQNGSALKVILTRLALVSPIDPLAGNPESLFSKRMRGDFEQGFTHKVSQIWGCGTSAFNFTNDQPIQVAAVGGVSDIFAEAQARAAELQAQNELGLGVVASSTTAKSAGGDFKTTGFVIPLSYTAKLDSDPRKKIRFDLPLTYTDTEGAISYSLGAGLAYTHPLSEVWSLTPALGFGATGSEDLGAAGGVGAYSLTSAYTWRLGGFALSMGNSVGRYEAIGLKIGDVEAEAEISNTVFTNGFLLTGPNSLIAKSLVVEYSFVDTRITGDDVYADGYDEIGIALGKINTTMGVIDSYTKAGLSYLIGDGLGGDISSIRLTVTSRF